MPRRARLAIAGIAWHIVQRGNNRARCFFADEDYRIYLAVLHEQAVRWRCAVHAYVLMTNHVHLLLTPEEADGPSRLMKYLGQYHAQYINRRYDRSGTLWEGRYRSCLAQNETYALACYRYIELNPVRAGMVSAPAEYAWSSFHVNGGIVDDSFLTPHGAYMALASTAAGRRASYRALFADQLGSTDIDRIRGATNGNFALGDARFQVDLAATLARRVTPGKTGRPEKPIASHAPSSSAEQSEKRGLSPISR